MEAIEINEFSDTTNFYLILFLFFMFYIYLKFIHIKIMSKMSWTEMQCNPSYMLIGSLIDSLMNTNEGNSVVNFDKCVRQIAERQLYEQHHNNMKDNERKVEQDLTMINSKVKGDLDKLDIKQSELYDLLENTNLSIEDTIEKQNKINQAIVDSSGNISDLTRNIGLLSDKFKTTITNFANNSSIKIT